jgi:hypothetical protein
MHRKQWGSMKKVVIKFVILAAVLLGASADADRQQPNQVDLLEPLDG